MQVEFRVIISSDDKIIREICEKYWMSKGKLAPMPIHKLKHLVVEYPNYDVKDLIIKYSYVQAVGFETCPKCQTSLNFKGRETLFSSMKYNKSQRCRNCRHDFYYKEYSKQNKKNESNQTNHNLNNINEADFPISTERYIKMLEAFQLGFHLSLEDREYNFLYYYCLTNDYTKTAQRMGYSMEIGTRIANKLFDLNLICEMTGFILPEVKSFMHQEVDNRKHKSIFGSGEYGKIIFNLLKEEYVYVFPKVSISQILENEFVQNKILAIGLKDKVIYSIVDFLVVDKLGYPKFAVDYQSTLYKNNSALNESILEKAGLLKECGVTHYFIDYNDIQNMKNNINTFKFPNDLTAK